MRRKLHRTAIPYYLVDALIEVPFGLYPANMLYEYYSDEVQILRDKVALYARLPGGPSIIIQSALHF